MNLSEKTRLYRKNLPASALGAFSQAEDHAWLLCSALPWPLGPLALHCWLVSQPQGQTAERWEVWPRQVASCQHWGHVHLGLCQPDRGMGLGPHPWSGPFAWSAQILTHWQASEARQLGEFLHQQAPRYPQKDHYLLWPGPNSNSFVAWVLQETGLGKGLPLRAWGRSWRAKPDQGQEKASG